MVLWVIRIYINNLRHHRFGLGFWSMSYNQIAILYALPIYLSIESPNNTVNEDAIEFVVDLLRVRTDDEYRIQGAIQAVREYCNSQNRKPY